MDIVNEFIRQNTDGYICPRMELNDGFTWSIQASEFHYCTPRRDGAHPYTTVEIGFPSEIEQEIMDYAEDDEIPTDTVYGHVPIAVVLRVIERRGGIKGVVED